MRDRRHHEESGLSCVEALVDPVCVLHDGLPMIMTWRTAGLKTLRKLERRPDRGEVAGPLLVEPQKTGWTRQEAQLRISRTWAAAIPGRYLTRGWHEAALRVLLRRWAHGNATKTECGICA
jgi:hypothetical protein